ncbi:MAG: hypothetical protein HY056_06495 [Proteobacteria bacterium]|nr:hypothetical protein [Pseudomonadota bacterium]
MNAHAQAATARADAVSLRQVAGRLCPVDYRYAPATFAREPEIRTEILYVVGGLYGNLAAFDALAHMVKHERQPATVVLNGDYHWFDAEAGWFAEVERRAEGYVRLRGNIETEIARGDDIGAGCGCAYPESVGDDVVRRSNDILRDLRATASAMPRTLARLAALPMHRVAAVGALRVGIVHGDAASLAGWGFARDRLDDREFDGWRAEIRRQSKIDVFASTHTCLAALRDYMFPSGRLCVINNGAAGMANFAGSTSGLVTRISTLPSRVAPLYGRKRDGVHIDALALDYDAAAFLERFLARWPAGSAAHQSYYQRIVAGPQHGLALASGAR